MAREGWSERSAWKREWRLLRERDEVKAIRVRERLIRCARIPDVARDEELPEPLVRFVASRIAEERERFVP